MYEEVSVLLLIANTTKIYAKVGINNNNILQTTKENDILTLLVFK